MKHIVWALCILVTALGTASGADSVRWNLVGSIIAGSGCQKDVDSFASTNGNDLAIVFTNLGVDLPGQSGLPLAQRKNCSVRVPAEISQGLYIGELTQRITYGVTKSYGSRGSLATRSTFFGFNVSPHIVTVPYGQEINDPLLVSSRVEQFLVASSWYYGWCRSGRNPKGLYQANLAVSGQRSSDFEDLIMFVDGLDVKFEVIASLIHCGV